MLEFEKPERVRTVSIRFNKWSVPLGSIIGRQVAKEKWTWKVLTATTTVEMPSLTAAKKWIKEKFT